MTNQRKCIIWGTDITYIEDHEARKNDRYIIDSPRAGGKYMIDHITHLATSRNGLNLNDKEKIRLSGYIEKQNLLDKIPHLDSIMEGVDKKWLEKIPPSSNYNERTELLLKGLVSLSSHLGETISLNLNVDQCKNKSTPFLYALSYCSKLEEFRLLINSLEEKGYIDKEGFIGGGLEIKVIGDGWEHIELASIDLKKNKEINSRKKSNKKSETAFIAMWIDSCMDELKQSIETVLENVGYKPLRIDDKEHNNKIDDEILSEINEARFVICDLTSEKGKPRGSVYFEAGYAIGKDIPIVWTCRKDQEKELPFDIRQYNFLFWDKDKMNDFTKNLQNRIENTVGKGPLK